ncbi:MAG: CAAX prenyl protease-related protein [Bryobacterales bacterium]|nr:CAAX prenyl protease-related protein [Bryobacterales bacterium]
MRNPSIPYVLPFVVFLVFLSLDGKLGLRPEQEYPLRVFLLATVLWVFSRKVIDLRVRNWGGTMGIGVLVFVLWIAPDQLIPGYRTHWLFQNSLLGAAPAPSVGYAGVPLLALVFRTIRATAIVPIVEELFWRAWLMRWLIKPDFQSVALGTYVPQAFWISAALFAAEHGPYWDVGLVAGVIYNWWMVRTKSLGDCILAHAVTNGVLSGYVLMTGQWQYW